MAGDIRIGCSGWSYPHWRKRFYPEKLPAREHFAFYAQHFNSVELNNSFYRQPPKERFVAWAEQAPPGFLFAVKGSRYITHIKRLVVESKSIDLVVDAADIRFALEFRHESWLVPAVFDVLRTHRIALCIPDHPKMPKSLEITSDFTYIRMHLPPSGLGYGERALQPWAQRIRNWSAQILDVFVYFNNDMEGHAIKDAQALISLLDF